MVEDKKILRKILSVESHPNADGKYVRAARASSLACWFERRASKPAEKMPVPKASPSDERQIVLLVDEMREARVASPNADTIDIQEELDWRVSELYGLTDEEALAVEDSFDDVGMSRKEKDAMTAKWIKAGRTGNHVSRSAVMDALSDTHGN